MHLVKDAAARDSKPKSKWSMIVHLPLNVPSRTETLTKTTSNDKANPHAVPMKGDVTSSSFGYGAVLMSKE